MVVLRAPPSRSDLVWPGVGVRRCCTLALSEALSDGESVTEAVLPSSVRA